MALYVTRPRRDEVRIGRGLPSDLTNSRRRYMAEILPIQRKTLSNQSIKFWNSWLHFFNSLKRILKLVKTNSTKFVITDSKILKFVITDSTKFVIAASTRFVITDSKIRYNGF